MSDARIMELYERIMKEFVYSRTADTFQDGQTIYDNRRRQYIFRNNEFYKRCDDEFNRNLNLYAPKNPSGRDNPYTGLESLYLRQRKLRYANCQGQAIFLSLLLHHENIDCIVIQTNSPNHAFVVAKGSAFWILVDPWAGRAGRLFSIAEIQSALIIRNELNIGCTHRSVIYMCKRLTKYYPFLAEYNDYRTGLASNNNLKSLLKEDDYYISLYICDFAPDVFAGLGQEHDNFDHEQKAYHNLVYNRTCLENNILSHLIKYKNVRSKGGEYNNVFRLGYTKEDKIQVVNKLISIIKGNKQTLTERDRKVLYNGVLGKTLEDILNKYGCLKLFELLCYNISVDDIENDAETGSVEHD